MDRNYRLPCSGFRTQHGQLARNCDSRHLMTTPRSDAQKE